LLSVAVISITVVADVYGVESSTYIDTMALLKDRGLNSYSGEFLPLPGLCLRGFH
jgi:hypothetical protein